MFYELVSSSLMPQNLIANDVLSMLVTQTWQVTLLIAIVWVAVKLFATDRPHLAHALWVLVLLKCLTPPIWSSPVSPFSWFGSPATTLVQVAQIEPDKRLATTANHPRLETIVVRIDQDQETQDDSIAIAAKPDSKMASVAVSGSALAVTSNQSWQSWLAIGWIVGAAIGLLVTLARVALFWRWIRRRVTAADPKIEGAIERLSRKLGVRRNVRVIVADQPVGPAVLGLLRPTILLPAAIVHEKTKSDLDPLLAHELIHIRRGDLWWAMVQTVAASLFWFHPLVWLAVRMVTRESERSCDEETVTSLGCQPATYARGLLEVLERKNQLRVAPALPGVRPVDITSARLERVMKLGNGSHRRTPAWIWFVLLVCGATVLPGAAMVLAQEQGNPLKTIEEVESSEPLKQNSREPEEYFVKGPEFELECATEKPISLAFQQDRDFARAKARQPEWKLETTDVSEIIKRIENSSDEPFSASSYLIAKLMPLINPANLLSKTPQSNLEIRKLNVAQPSLRIVDNMLEIYGNDEHIKTCGELLTEYRKVGFKQIVVETRMLTMPQEQMRRLKIGWTVVPSPGTTLTNLKNGGYDATKVQPLNGIRQFDAEKFEKLNPIGTVTSSSIVEKNTPVMYAVINEAQAKGLVQQSKSQASSNILQAPTVTMFNGQTASVRDGKQRPFVVAVNRIEEPETKAVAYQPVVQVFDEGNTVNLKAELKDEVTLNLNCEMTNLKILKVDTADLPTPEGDKKVSIQVPEIAKTQIRSSLEMESGKTVVLNCLQSNKKGEQESMLVMLRCTVVDSLTQNVVKVSAEEPVEEPVAEEGVGKGANAAKAAYYPVDSNLSPTAKHADPNQSNNSSTPSAEAVDLLIKASGNSDEDSLSRETIETLGLRIQMIGDVRYSINNEGATIEGKQMSLITPGDGEMEVTGDDGRLEIRKNDSGEPAAFNLKFNGNAKLQMMDAQYSADAIEFATDDMGIPTIKLTGKGSVSYEENDKKTNLSADRITFRGFELMTLSGNAHYEHEYNKDQLPIKIHADQIRWNAETNAIDTTKSDK